MDTVYYDVKGSHEEIEKLKAMVLACEDTIVTHHGVYEYANKSFAQSSNDVAFLKIRRGPSSWPKRKDPIVLEYKEAIREFTAINLGIL